MASTALRTPELSMVEEFPWAVLAADFVYISEIPVGK